MSKNILSFIFALGLLIAAPVSGHATASIEIVDNDFQSISISLNDESVLRVTGAAGQVLSVYNITGVKVLSIKVDGSDKSFNLNLPKGCYIVKVGKVVRKISIK